MAICRIVETGATPDRYDAVREAVGIRDSTPPGGLLHIAARGDDGNIRVIEVWETREQAEAFGEKVRAARESLGFATAMPEITYLDVHNLIRA